MTDFNWTFEHKIVKAMKNSDKAYLITIEQMVKDLRYGRLDFSLRVHDGRVTDIVTVVNKRIRFDSKLDKVSDDVI